MKRVSTILFLALMTFSLTAQKVKVKKDIVYVDGVEIAKIKGERSKAALGLVKDFTVSNMDGKELFTAVYTDKIPEDPNNNTIFYFEFDFMTVDKTAYFGVSKLGTMKSIGNIVGKHNLIKDGEINEKALATLIKKKGKTPPVVAEYDMADRPRNFPVELREKGELSQASTVFATYQDKGTVQGKDIYEFYAPNGVLAVRVSFSGGNNATSFLVETFKDNREHNVGIPQKEKIDVVIAIDRNYYTLKRLGKWIVDNNYL